MVFLFLFFRSFVRWWYGRKENESNAHPEQWEIDYLINGEPELRMFYEYHDMGNVWSSLGLKSHVDGCVLLIY